MAKSFLILTIFLTSFLIVSCSTTDKTITSLPYDPPGATITTDKEISPQY
ncbi:MAG: hypothetical protein KJO59_01370 [Ignavibacteria bacterium]|nr:hypothetical protein [Ignavibacteria bacterium]